MNYDYENLVAEHIYCDAPEMLLNCEEIEAMNLGMNIPDSITSWLVSDYLAGELVDAGEFVVRLDDCNVWESESDSYNLSGQLKFILES